MGMVFSGFYIGGILFAILVPAWIKRSHVRAQNRLLERCTALYVAGIKAWEGDNEGTARNYLARIRRIEGRWRLGHSIIYRIALAIYAIGVGLFGYVALRILSLSLADVANGRLSHVLVKFFDPASLNLLVMAAAFGSFWALKSYFGEWTNPWAIADCGDRLQRLLNAARNVTTRSQSKGIQGEPLLGGLSPRQVFGLGPQFSRRKLDRARRRLVKKLHPDLFHHANPFARSAREEAMKRVNAAYDALRPLAV